MGLNVILESTDKKALLLLVDFEKTFDSIEWSCMRKLLEAYNFGTDLLTWFDILYKDPKSCVLNDGNFSEFFNLSKSCRQGNPLSPYLFTLSIEHLSMEIKGNKNVKGIKPGNITLKIGQYADDIFVILDGSESSLQSCIDIFDSFKRCSGLMNAEKRQVIWLGIKDTLNQKKLCPKISWIKRLIRGIGNWQDIFEFITGLNKTLVWDLDCVSLKKISDNIKNRFLERSCKCG